MILIENFKKQYGSQLVLKVDRLSINNGIFWLKGENGSGKSTFLRALAGIIDFDGNVILNKNSIDLKKQPIAYRKMVNFAEAEPVFPAFLTGIEMINLFSEAKSASRSQIDFYVESMGMNVYINEPIGSYSSGMLKKLALTISFLGYPELILLDEPLSTIDQASLLILFDWIKNKNSSEGTGFLLSSHQEIEPQYLNLDGEILVKNHSLKLIR